MPLNLLIVDDSKTSRAILKSELSPLQEEKGLVIEEAFNGADAINKCRENQYDAVFLDLTMPDISGYDVLETFKNEGIKQSVFVLSADIQPGAEALVKKQGAIDFIKKPLERGKHLPVQILRENKII